MAMFDPEKYGMVFDVSDSSEAEEEEEQYSATKSTTSSKPVIKSELTEKFNSLKERRQELLRRAEMRKSKQRELKEKREKKKAEARLAEKRKSQTDGGEQPGPTEEAIEQRWAEIRSLIDCNQRLEGMDHGRYAQKSGMGEKIEDAIEAGDVTEAEKLSDQLANREFGRKVADAFDADSWNKEQEAKKKQQDAKKKRKLNWGFEHKQRWETKGNM